MEEKYIKLSEITQEYQEKLDSLMMEYRTKVENEAGVEICEPGYTLYPHMFVTAFTDLGKTLDVWRSESDYTRQFPESRTVNREFRLNGVNMVETKLFDGEPSRVMTTI